MNWHDPTIQAALIQALGSVVGTMIAGVMALAFAVVVGGIRRIINKSNRMAQDLLFLQMVERKHCEAYEGSAESRKREIRKLVKEQGYTWSGRFVPSRLREERDIDL